MPSGLQVWDANGNLVIDITTRLFRFLGSVNSGTAAGSINDPALLQGTPFPFVVQNGTAPGQFGPEVTFSGSTMSWTFPSAAQSPPRPAIASTIYYGVY